jgi:hypothetical protein
LYARNPLAIRGDFEFRAQFGIAVAADPNLEAAGFKDLIAVVVQIGKFLQAEPEREGFPFSSLTGRATEATRSRT